MTDRSEIGGRDAISPPVAYVPLGWQRKVEGGSVVYFSPSSTELCSAEEVATYLLTDGTCKCGLECPLVLNQMFNFDPGAQVRHESQLAEKAEGDMTKLCNHRRKVVAMAALCRSMQTCYTAGFSTETTSKAEVHLSGIENEASCTSSPLPDLSIQSKPRVSLSPSPTLYGPERSSTHLAASLPTPSPSVFSYCRSHSSEVPVPSRKLPSPCLVRPSLICYRSSQKNPRSPVSSTPSPDRTPEQPSKQVSFGSVDVLGGLRAGQCSWGAQSHQSAVSGSPSSFLSRAAPSGSLNCPSPVPCTSHSSASSFPERRLGAIRTCCSSSSPLAFPVPGGASREQQEAVLQWCNTNTRTAHHCKPQHNQSNYLIPLARQHSPSAFDRKKGRPNTVSAAAPVTEPTDPKEPLHPQLGLHLDQLRNQQKYQQHVDSFPASSLLSAAAKAQLDGRQNFNQNLRQNLSNNLGSATPLTGVCEEAKSSVTISTLNSSCSPSVPTFSLLSVEAPVCVQVSDTLQQYTQRRCSPVLHGAPKELPPRSTRETGDLATLSPSSTSAGPAPLSVRHGFLLQQSDVQENRVLSLPGVPVAPPPTQPLSTFLHLLSVQNAHSAVLQDVPIPPVMPEGCVEIRLSPQNVARNHSTVVLATSNTIEVDPKVIVCPLDNRDSFAQEPLMTSNNSYVCVPHASCSITGQHSNRESKLGPSHIRESLFQNSRILCSTTNSSQSKSAAEDRTSVPTPEAPVLSPPQRHLPVPGDMETCSSHSGSQPLQETSTRVQFILEQPSSSSPVPLVENSLEVKVADSLEQNHDASKSSLPVAPHDNLVNKTDVCIPSPAPTAPSANVQVPDTFPLLTQEQILDLLSATPGLPPFLHSLPVGLWVAGQQTQLPVMPSVIGPENLPLNWMGLVSPVSTSGQGGVEIDKPGLQTLLMASLVLEQQQTAPMFPLDLVLQHNHFLSLEDGFALGKSSGSQDSLLSGPGLLEALQGLCTPAEGILQKMQATSSPAEGAVKTSQATSLPEEGALQVMQAISSPEEEAVQGSQGTGSLADSTLQALQALVFPASFIPLGPPLLNSHPAPQDQPQVAPPCTVMSSGLSGAPPMPASASDVTDVSMLSLAKNSVLPQHLLPSVVTSEVVGDIAASGTVSSFDSLLGSGPLLLPPVPAQTMDLAPTSTSALGMTFIRAQMADTAKTCPLKNVQLNTVPLPATEEMELVHTQEPDRSVQADVPASSLDQEAVSSSMHHLGREQQHTEQEGGPINPYAFFMDTIYTSFLQVSGKCPNGGSSQATVPPVPPQPSAPVSLSSRRACSMRNSDLSWLNMEAAQSPASGTPKPSEDLSCMPPPSQPGGLAIGTAAGLHSRKRRQTEVRLQREPAVSNGTADQALEPSRSMVGQQTPERLVKSKRRRALT